MEIKDDHIIPTRDVNKYYFYITEGGDIVLGFEKDCFCLCHHLSIQRII